MGINPSVFGRNYFSRSSAPEQEDDEDAEECAASLADAIALKKLAVDYAHPEDPVVTSDPSVFGRNYFCRPSASQHLEKPVKSSDPAAFGRNYFCRPLAPCFSELVSSTGVSAQKPLFLPKEGNVQKDPFDFDGNHGDLHAL